MNNYEASARGKGTREKGNEMMENWKDELY